MKTFKSMTRYQQDQLQMYWLSDSVESIEDLATRLGLDADEVMGALDHITERSYH